MVTNDEIRRMLDAKRRGVDIKKEKIQSMSYKTCPKCGAKNPEKALFCVQCGKNLDQKLTVTCPSCGVENAKNAKFCVECGETLNQISQTVNESKTDAEENPETIDNEISEPEEVDEDETITEGMVETKSIGEPVDVPETEQENQSVPNSKPKNKPIPSIRVPSSLPEHKLINQRDTKKTCSSCQSKNLKNAKFCVVCGEKFIDTSETDKKDITVDKNGHEDVSDKTDKTTLESNDKSEKDDPIEKIKKAKELLDIAAITEEEFESIKKKYLEQI